MPNSYIEIEFTSVPIADQSLSFTESLNTIVFSEIFKAARLSAFQTQIPGQNAGKYQMTTNAIDAIYDYGVNYTAIGGANTNVTLASIPVNVNSNGTYTFTILAESSIVFYNLVTMESVLFPGGSFENVGSYFTAFISETFKTAFDLDYNSGYLFTVEVDNGEVGSGLGKVKITANYINAFFSAGTYTFAKITVVNDAFVSSVSPDELDFTVEISSPVASPQSISIVAETDWEIVELPDWLSATETEGTESQTIEIVPINFSELSIGVHLYELDIKIGDDHFFVNIALNVLKAIINPYLPNQFAFTLDPKYFTIVGERTDTYFQINSTISIHKFFSNEIVTRMIPQKALLYKGQCKIYLGQLIHRLMDNFETVNVNENQYHQAKLNIVCKEIKIDDGSTVSTITVPEIKFVAGLSQGFSNFGFLEFNPKPTRVTTAGYYFLNILIPNGNYELKRFKNGQLESTVELPSLTNGPLCYKVLFDTYSKGDFIEFVIYENGIITPNAPRKGFYIFPDQMFSNVIVWENEFLLQSALEFTNDQDISMEIERQTSKKVKGLIEKTTHHSVSKENKLTINTGWISKNDLDSIESLLLSKRAFLPTNGKIIELVPIGKTFKGYNSEQELYDYTFEFTINRIYNEETYTF